MMSEAGAAAILAGLAGFLFVLVAVLLVFYVLKSIGLMTMAANKGIENAWLAWIPIADLYIAGSIVEEMDLFGNRLTNLGMWLPVIMVGGMIIGIIPVIGTIISLAAFVFFLMFSYQLFSMYSPSQAVLFTVLSILGLWAIFVFVIRNNQPVGQTSSGGNFTA